MHSLYNQGSGADVIEITLHTKDANSYRASGENGGEP